MNCGRRWLDNHPTKMNPTVTHSDHHSHLVKLCDHDWVTEARDYVAKFRDCSVTLQGIDHEVCSKCGAVEIADSTWRIIDSKLFANPNPIGQTLSNVSP
jgi:hypothetical protein